MGVGVGVGYGCGCEWGGGWRRGLVPKVMFT